MITSRWLLLPTTTTLSLQTQCAYLLPPNLLLCSCALCRSPQVPATVLPSQQPAVASTAGAGTLTVSAVLAAPLMSCNPSCESPPVPTPQLCFAVALIAFTTAHHQHTQIRVCVVFFFCFCCRQHPPPAHRPLPMCCCRRRPVPRFQTNQSSRSRAVMQVGRTAAKACAEADDLCCVCPSCTSAPLCLQVCRGGWGAPS